MRYLIRLMLPVVILIQACATTVERDLVSDREMINRVMDDFHEAAAMADKSRYLAHFSATGVFMGTDDWERWPLPAFRQYVDERFKEGVGWTYKAVERHIAFADAADTAWLDEITESEKWGRFRGTAVLVRVGDTWKLAHYSLSVLVPNEAWDQTLSVVKEAFTARQAQPSK